MEDKLLVPTKMLDYESQSIWQLIEERGWKKLSEFDRIKSIYTYVRDEILIGYNIDDDIPASKVLSDGYGQCNTKGTLFMALLRACGIPCRVHGFTIDKKLQKGAMTGFVYRNAPQNVFHSWVPCSISSSFSARIRSRRTEAGSSSSFCGTSLPRIARSRILDFVVATSSKTSSLLFSIETINSISLLVFAEISRCSF